MAEKNVKDKPKLRFEGYNDGWAQHKLEDLIETCGSGGTPSTTTEEYYKGNIPFLSISDISNSDGYITDTEKHITPAALASCAAWIVPRESISLAMYASVGKVAILKNDSATSQAFFNMVISNLPLRNFLYQHFKKMEYGGQWQTLISTGTQPNLNAEKVKNLYVPLPVRETEYELIGDTLSNLDFLITLHQRKLSKLQDLKKALLVKMFPAEGESVPAVRFKGFSDAWEQRKLGELMMFQNGYNGSGEDFGTSGIPLISVLDILQDQFIDSGNIRSKVNISQDDAERYVVEYGDVLFQRSSETHEDAGRSNVYIDKASNSVFGGFVIRGKKNAEYSPFFIKYMLDTAPIRRQITSKAQGAQHINVSQDTLSEVIAYLPSLEEQELIGTKLHNIDTLITFQQRKLSKLKDIKKALLNNMFPGGDI